MKKILKYSFLMIICILILNMRVNAVTIIETTEKDSYDNIETGSVIIGVTKFNSDTIITGAKATTAGSNDTKFYVNKNNNLDGYEVPNVYVYCGVGGWVQLDEENNANIVTDDEIIDELSHKEIYYVDNVEKKIEIDVNELEVDVERLPDGIALKKDKLLVNATLNNFDIFTTSNQKLSYISNSGIFVENSNTCFTVLDGYITGYDIENCVSKVVIPEKIEEEQIIGIKESAFDNLGITSVDIPKTIMTIEDNAFANNNLSKVVIREKYDPKSIRDENYNIGKFSYLGNNVFGSFDSKKIIYDNDLTRILDLYDNKIVININKNIKFIDDNELNDFLIVYTEYRESKKNGLNPYMYAGCNIKNDYYVNFYFTDGVKVNSYERMDKMEILVGKQYNPVTVSKTVDYEYHFVDVDEENELEAKKVLDDGKKYYYNLVNNLSNDFYANLDGSEYYENLFNSYNLDYGLTTIYPGGAYVGGKIDDNIDNPMTFVPVCVGSGDTVYTCGKMYETENIGYNLKLESIENETEEALFERMKNEFIKISKFDDYSIMSNLIKTPGKNNGLMYKFTLRDNKTGNLWDVYTELQLSDKFVDMGYQKLYFPSNKYKGGNVTDYLNSIKEELSSKYSIIIEKEHLYCYKRIVEDEVKLFDIEYVLYTNDNKQYNINFIIDNIDTDKLANEFYVSSNDSLGIDANEYSSKEEYIDAFINKFKETNSIDDLYYDRNFHINYTNPETGVTNQVDNDVDDEENAVYMLSLVDFNHFISYTINIPYKNFNR